MAAEQSEATLSTVYKRKFGGGKTHFARSRWIRCSHLRRAGAQWARRRALRGTGNHQQSPTSSDSIDYLPHNLTMEILCACMATPHPHNSVVNTLIMRLSITCDETQHSTKTTSKLPAADLKGVGTEAGGTGRRGAVRRAARLLPWGSCAPQPAGALRAPAVRAPAAIDARPGRSPLVHARPRRHACSAQPTPRSAGAALEERSLCSTGCCWLALGLVRPRS